MTDLPDLTEMVNGQMPLGTTLGIRTWGTAEEVVAELDWTPEFCTGQDVLHGGVLMALADSAGAVCAFLNLPAAAVGTTTIESKTNFFAAVRSGTVRARSRPLHRGRTTIVVETDLHDGDGRHVARTTQTQAVLSG